MTFHCIFCSEKLTDASNGLWDYICNHCNILYEFDYNYKNDTSTLPIKSLLYIINNVCVASNYYTKTMYVYIEKPFKEVKYDFLVPITTENIKEVFDRLSKLSAFQ